MSTDKDEIILEIKTLQRGLEADLNAVSQKLVSLETSNETILLESITRLSNELYLLKTREQESFLTLKDDLERILDILKEKNL